MKKYWKNSENLKQTVEDPALLNFINIYLTYYCIWKGNFHTIFNNTISLYLSSEWSESELELGVALGSFAFLGFDVRCFRIHWLLSGLFLGSLEPFQPSAGIREPSDFTQWLTIIWSSAAVLFLPVGTDHKNCTSSLSLISLVILSKSCVMCFLKFIFHCHKDFKSCIVH